MKTHQPSPELLGYRPAGAVRAGFAVLTLAATVLLTAAGCNNSSANLAAHAGVPTGKPDAIIPGDVLKINFVGAPTLDTQQEVRRDGRISLPMAGDIVAEGLTPTELTQELTKRFAKELLSNEVLVTVVSSAFSVNVTGAVQKPGKYTSKGPMTVLQAVMEAGGFQDAKANTKRVVVVRHHEGKVENYVLDLSAALQGRTTEPFYLRPADIVYVPTRFVWF